jgi:hypothetical protein
VGGYRSVVASEVVTWSLEVSLANQPQLAKAFARKATTQTFQTLSGVGSGQLSPVKLGFET